MLDAPQTFLKKIFAAYYHWAFTYNLQHYFCRLHKHKSIQTKTNIKQGLCDRGVGVGKTEIQDKRKNDCCYAFCILQLKAKKKSYCLLKQASVACSGVAKPFDF